MHKIIIFLLLISINIQSNSLLDPTSLSKDLYTKNILSGDYEDNIDHPSQFLDFKYGDRVASPEQITNALGKWSKQSSKLKVVEYARTHEDRPLHAVFISSSNNLNNLNNIKNNISKLSDARKTSDREAAQIINNLPAVAWMAYSIHGNETSGADAAMGVIYHLIASKDEDILNMLDEMIIIIDPLMLSLIHISEPTRLRRWGFA